MQVRPVTYSPAADTTETEAELNAALDEIELINYNIIVAAIPFYDDMIALLQAASARGMLNGGYVFFFLEARLLLWWWRRLLLWALSARAPSRRPSRSGTSRSPRARSLFSQRSWRACATHSPLTRPACSVLTGLCLS